MGTPEIPSYWTIFLRQQKTLETLENFSIKTSINYSSSEHKHRMIMRLFGRLSYPIRMDLEAGIGRTISMWREETDIWQAYFPEEKKLYTASDAKFGVQSLGFPCPFDLQELSLVLQGKLRTILPDQPVREKLQDTGSRIFFAQPARMESIYVDSLGRVLELVGSKGWRVVFDYQDASLYSQKISMLMDDTTSAVIRVKSIKTGNFATDLAFELPDDTELIDIDTISPVRTNGNNPPPDSRTNHPGK